MRTTLLVLGAVLVTGVITIVVLLDRNVTLPPLAPSVESICVEAMRSAPDLSWTANNRDLLIRGREMKTVSLGELPFHNADLVRVAGVLHAEFEWVALYPSRAAMREGFRAPWISFQSLWPNESYWRTKGPAISDRCVVVEGTYSAGRGGHFGVYNGTIQDVVRLDVWSTPGRPFTNPPTPPPPARLQ